MSELNLPWVAKFTGSITKRHIVDNQRHTVNLYDPVNAEYLVNAINNHESNQSRIKQLESALEAALEELKECYKDTGLLRISEKIIEIEEVLKGS